MDLKSFLESPEKSEDPVRGDLIKSMLRDVHIKLEKDYKTREQRMTALQKAINGHTWYFDQRSDLANGDSNPALYAKFDKVYGFPEGSKEPKFTVAEVEMMLRGLGDILEKIKSEPDA